MANSVDPEEVAHDEPPHLNLYCFANSAAFIPGALNVNVTMTEAELQMSLGALIPQLVKRWHAVLAVGV